MDLVLCNTQSELHPLEEGKHAAESGMDLKAYAERAGKVYRTLHTKTMAWKVMSVSDIGIDQARANWSNLAEIHAAPSWLWPALVAKMLEKQWTVALTRVWFCATPKASCTHWKRGSTRRNRGWT
jgi:hypothetical protein